MSTRSSIFLVGPMGVGKSYTGRKISQKLSWQFYDSDDEIEKRTGASINLIFELEREDGFRKREAKIVSELTLIPEIVLATGGGTVLVKENRQNLVQRGFVVYLKASLDLLLTRMSGDTKRPLLKNVDPTIMLEKILDIRCPLYEEIADIVIDVENIPINSVVSQIIAAQ